MTAHLALEFDGTIPMKDLTDGQVAVIVGGAFDGEIVQCIDNQYDHVSHQFVQAIGAACGLSWSFEYCGPTLSVRVLPEGTTIVL